MLFFSLLILPIVLGLGASPSLYDDFHNSTFVNDMPTLFSRCTSALSASTSNRNERELQFCSTIDYLMEIKNLDLAYRNSHRKNRDSSSAEILVERLDSKVPYSTLFENYILKSKPFTVTAEDSVHSASEILSMAADSIAATNSFTKDISVLSLEVGRESDRNMVLPKILINNYLRRLNVTEDIDKLLDYKTQWPAVKMIGEASNELEYCPAGMHLLLWGPSSDEIKISIVTREVAARSMETDFTFDDVEQNRRPLHHPKFRYQDGEEMSPGFIEIPLKKNDYLFIPNSFLVYFGSIEAEQSSSLFKMCFVDASNLNLFRESLSVYSKVYEYDYSVLSALSNPTFDAAMVREPNDISLKDYISISVDTDGNDTSSLDPAAVKVTGSRKDRRKAKTANKFKDWQAVNKWNLLVNSLTIPVPPVPTVLDIGRDNVTLSWASSFVPVYSDQSRFGFRVEICEAADASFSSPMFSTLSAFALNPPRASTNASDQVQEMVCNHKDFVRSTSVKLNPEMREVKKEMDGAEKSVFTVNIRHLRPNTAYHFSVALFYDITESKKSALSNAFVTQSITAPSAIEWLPHHSSMAVSSHLDSVSVEFIWPLDDGGDTIQGLHVFARKHDSLKACSAVLINPTGKVGAIDKWSWLGAYTDTSVTDSGRKIELKNLVPNAVYDFRISVYNSVGNSSLSDSTGCFVFEVTKEGDSSSYTLFGVGHEMHSGGTTGSLQYQSGQGAEHVARSYQSDTLVEIKSENQAIRSFSDKTKTVDLWRCYWGGSFYNIVSNYAIVDPPLADDHIKNGDNLIGRIAVVDRGGVPFVEKVLRVQRAGAIAVVIVDDGSCTAYDQQCIPGANRDNGEDFAILDYPTPWQEVRIPVFFALQDVYLTVLSENKEEAGTTKKLKIVENDSHHIEL